VPLLVVRHASAGNPSEWKGDDLLRPLDEKGWRQARGLPALLAARPLDRLVSSPAFRCTQTLEPLAIERGLDVETSPDLMEGSSPDAAHAILRDVGDDAAICTHGDVLEHLFGEAGKKGSTRVVQLRDGELVVLEYLKPPA